MKIYTVYEVLDAIIPNGECGQSLQHLYQDIEHFTAASFYTKDENKPLVESLCLAFSILMAYAKGELVEKAEVLGMVEDTQTHSEYTEDNLSADWAVDNIKRRIEALGGGK
jgi:hypothetical protein